MEKKDLLHLASLSRIRITDEEAESLKTDIDAVLEYVSVVSEITSDDNLVKKVGARYNVFREDEVTCEPDTYTEALLDEAPSTRNRFLEVKKILQQD